jgi:hypothetical protein
MLAMKQFFITSACCFGIVISLHAQILYQDAAAARGIQHIYNSTTPGCGVSCVDFNNDGLDDITLGSESGQPIRFYLNMGGQFTLLQPLVPHLDEVKQLLWVDFDNDADKDLFVCNYEGVNRLYRNTGNLTFEDITLSAGLPLDAFHTFGAVWGDYDRDGLLDLYYNERKLQLSGLPNENRLFRNNGNGTFTEVTPQAQAADSGKTPFCSAFLDYNNDKWPDIYTAQDRLRINSLLRNNGNGTFSNVSVATNTNLAMNAMCVAAGDYDNNGWLDIYISNTEEGNALLRNSGPDDDGQVVFEEVAASAGVAFNSIGWGSVFLDADNDGDLDLYVSGMLAGADVISSAFYENMGNGSFLQPNAGFVGDTVTSFSNATGDFDNNGYPDIMVANTAPFASQLWLHQGTTSNNWLKIKLQGILSNRDGIGAKIEIYTGSHYQMRYTHCGIGFLGQNSDTEIIGIGSATQADSILITWPTGHIDRLLNVVSGQKLVVVEGSTTGGDIFVDPEIISHTSDLPADQPQAAHLFPNPATDELHVQLIGNDIRFWSVLDTYGRVLMSDRIRAAEWNIAVQYLSSGLYFILFLQEDGQVIMQKWIKR